MYSICFNSVKAEISIQNDTIDALHFWRIVFNAKEKVSINSCAIKYLSYDHYKQVQSLFDSVKEVNHEIELYNVHCLNYFNSRFNRVVRPRIYFDSVQFNSRVWMGFENLYAYSFRHCTFKDRANILGSTIQYFSIDSCSFLNGCYFNFSDSENHVNFFNLKNSLFKANEGTNGIYSGASELQLILRNNRFERASSGAGILFNIRGTAKEVQIDSCDFSLPLAFDLSVSDFLTTKNSTFENIDLQRSIFPEYSSSINFKWKYLSNKLAYFRSNWNHEKKQSDPCTYNILDIESAKDEEVYDRLKVSAYRLMSVYKDNGDLESYNLCYRDIKLLETNRLKYLYSQNPTFETYFRWKLNQFLNYFTDYGTNPAKAVIKSIWVILIFAVFYLFFPSDWDITNRAEFLKRWKELFRNKKSENSKKRNGKYILSTVFYFLYSGLIHILNALTLSLNAFTTLGFGDIPTRGAARYVTIVQGFIGWFLLTIFSVSLINQVLG